MNGNVESLRQEVIHQMRIIEDLQNRNNKLTRLGIEKENMQYRLANLELEKEALECKVNDLKIQNQDLQYNMDSLADKLAAEREKPLEDRVYELRMEAERLRAENNQLKTLQSNMKQYGQDWREKYRCTKGILRKVAEERRQEKIQAHREIKALKNEIKDLRRIKPYNLVCGSIFMRSFRNDMITSLRTCAANRNDHCRGCSYSPNGCCFIDNMLNDAADMLEKDGIQISQMEMRLTAKEDQDDRTGDHGKDREGTSGARPDHA